MGAKDVQKIRSLVKDQRYAYIDSSHGIYMVKPQWYLKQVNSLLDGIQAAKNNMKPVTLK
jgi:hypothetical protein